MCSAVEKSVQQITEVLMCKLNCGLFFDTGLVSKKFAQDKGSAN